MTENTAPALEQASGEGTAVPESQDAAPQGGENAGAAAPQDAQPSAAQAGQETPEFDWRAAMSGGDEKLKKQLERYSTISDAGKAMVEQRAALSKRVEERRLSDEPSEKEIAEYREHYGIPETPDKYEITAEIAEGDKALAGLFAQGMHELHATPEELNKALSVWNKMRATVDAEIAESAKAALEQNTRDLKTAFGGDLEKNLNINTNYLNRELGEETARMLFGGKDANGNPVGGGMDAEGNPLQNHPVLMAWINKIARQDGFSDPTPYGDSQAMSRVDTRLDEIQTMRMDSSSRLHRDSAYRTQVEAEEIELLEMRRRANGNTE